MSVLRDQIEKNAKIRKHFTPARAGVHKWMKKQMNRFIRRNKNKMPVFGKFRLTRGWEY